MNFHLNLSQMPIIWLVYAMVYLSILYRILSSSRLETNEKTLWFLVITFVPLFGMLAYARIAWKKT